MAERWLSDSKRMQPVHDTHQGTVLVEGKKSDVLPVADRQKVTGHDLIQGEVWQWRQHPWEDGVRDVRLRATRPTYVLVTVVIVDEPGQDRVSLRCPETERSAPQLIRRWRRRRGSAVVLRTLPPLLATESWQVHRADASYEHLV